MRNLYEYIEDWCGADVLCCENCGATDQLIMDKSSMSNSIYCVSCAKNSYIDTDDHVQLCEVKK